MEESHTLIICLDFLVLLFLCVLCEQATHKLYFLSVRQAIGYTRDWTQSAASSFDHKVETLQHYWF